MPFKMLLPFLYLFCGFLLGKTKIDIKDKTAYLLTRIIIPLVIVYNIATCRSDLFFIIFSMIVMMTVLMFLSRLLSTDPAKQLCFFYLNIGWLSLPIVTAVWGDAAATAVLSLYIGNSIFGNSVGAGMLINRGAAKIDIKRTLKSPPVAALIIGAACIPFSAEIKQYLPPAYRTLKLIMSILGMGVLGMWLAKIKLELTDLKETLRLALYRALAFGVLISLFIFISGRLGVNLVTENKPALYMICILPPAANIIALETHYCHTGTSAGLTAWGTLFSLLLIAVYLSAVKFFF